MAWSPTRRMLAVSTAGGNLTNELQIIDLAHGGKRILARAQRDDPAAFFGSIAWSPQRRWIAVTRSRSLYGAEIDLLDATTGTLYRSYPVSARYDSALAWSRDGTRLYFTGQKSDRAHPMLLQLVISTGAVLSVDHTRGLDPSVSSKSALAFTSGDGVRTIRGGQERKIAGTKPGDRFAAWIGNGKQLLVERPTPNCPRYASPGCSHVLLLATNRDAPLYLLRERARNPATSG